MDSTKNFFDAWMNTQSKFVDNLMDTSKKIQKSLNNGEVVEKSVELYNKWFDNQKTLTDAMLHSMKDGEGSETTPIFFKDWMESQMELGKQWMEYLNYAANANENADDQNLGVYIQNMQNLYEEWNRIYNELFSQWGNSSGGLNIPTGFNNRGFSDIINSTHTYMKMFELWQPIYKMMQSNTMGVDSLSKILDMDQYKNVLDGIFHFMDPDKSKNFIAMINQYNGIMMDTLNKQSFGQFEQFIPNVGLFDKNITTLAQMATQFSEKLNKFIDPYFVQMPAGREKDMLGLVINLQEKYTKYYIKAVEMQNMVYTSGQASIEKAVRQIMNMSHEKSSLVSFDEFYITWVNTLEEDTIQLFGSDAYAKLQGDLLTLGLEIKADLDKQMEHILAPIPVVPRSEMDELNATVHELKSKVRHLEKSLKNALKNQQ